VTAQPSLFGSADPVAVDEPSPPHRPRLHDCAIVREPACPYGKPDRKGRYWYQRFHADLEKLPAKERAALQEMIFLWPWERLATASKLLNRYRSASEAERDNLWEAMGR